MSKVRSHKAATSVLTGHTQFMTPTRLLILSVALLLFGCAGNPPVQPAATSKSQFDGAVYGGETAELQKPTPGAEVYRAFYQGGSGFVSVSSVREAVEEMATKQCARTGKAARPLQETTSKPPHVLGNFPRVEWLFECTTPLATSSPSSAGTDKLGQIERLKKLLDSGALTQQEFEREKAKVLGPP
jgi:Short C-terminal domain